MPRAQNKFSSADPDTGHPVIQQSQMAHVAWENEYSEVPLSLV